MLLFCSRDLFKTWSLKTAPVLLHWLAYQDFLQIFFLLWLQFWGFLRHSCFYKAPAYVGKYIHMKRWCSFTYADTVRAGQHYHTKGIYEETCKIHPYFCIILIFKFLCLCIISLFFSLLVQITFSEPHRDANLGRESRMLFKMVLICLLISFLRDIKTE